MVVYQKIILNLLELELSIKVRLDGDIKVID